MDPFEQLTSILEQIKTRTGEALGLQPDQVYVGGRRTGEEEGAAAFINATIETIEGGTFCTERATVVCEIGFHLPMVGTEPDTTQRLRSVFALRTRFVWKGANPDAIPNVGLSKLIGMSFTDPEDPDDGYYAGGLAFQFQTDLVKP